MLSSQEPSQMKKILLLVLLSLPGISTILIGQVKEDSATISYHEHARYKNGNIKEALGKVCLYPRDALVNHIQGDVILSFTISKKGKMENPGAISITDVNLYNNSVKALNSIDNEWLPCMENGKAVDRNYSIVFRYRIYTNSRPPAYRQRADKLFKKEKYKKALKFYNRAIEENKYDHLLYSSRSKVKNLLGDSEGAATDLAETEKLKNSVLTVIDLTGLIETRTEIRVEKITTGRRY